MAKKKDPLQGVTDKLLQQVEDILNAGEVEPQVMKHLSAVLKDIRDIRKETAKDPDTGVTITMSPEVEQYAG